MLSPADARLAAADPNLPGLRVLLDPERMGRVLAPFLPEGASSGPVSPSYLRYKPATSCLAGFDLSTDDGPLRLYAKALPEERFAEQEDRLERPALVTELGPSRLVADEHRLIIRGFPNDRALKPLARLSDSHKRRKLLRALLPPGLAAAQLRTLRYKPERRFVGALCRKDTVLAILRLYDPSDLPQAAAGAAYAARHGGASILATDETLGMLVTDWLPGRSLDRVLGRSSTTADDPLFKSGRLIARLQRSGTDGLPVPGTDERAAGILAAAGAVGNVLPGLAADALDLGARAADALALDEAGLVPCHGDFSVDQIIAQPDGVQFIDWDRAHAGASGQDLASALADLEARALAGSLPRGAAQQARRRLLAGYRAEAGRLPAGLSSHLAAALIRLAPEPFRTRHPDWPGRTEAMLRAAALALDALPAPILRDVA